MKLKYKLINQIIKIWNLHGSRWGNCSVKNEERPHPGNIIEGIDVDFPYSHLIKKVIKKINKNNPKRVKDILLGKIVQNDPKL